METPTKMALYMREYNKTNARKLLAYKKKVRLEQPEMVHDLDKRYRLKRIKADPDYYRMKYYLFRNRKLKHNISYQCFIHWKYFYQSKLRIMNRFILQLNKYIINKYFYTWNCITLLKYAKVRQIIDAFHVGKPKQYNYTNVDMKHNLLVSL